MYSQLAYTTPFQYALVITIGRGNGAMLVLLKLSAAFDTIDHVICFAYLKNMSEFVVMLLK